MKRKYLIPIFILVMAISGCGTLDVNYNPVLQTQDIDIDPEEEQARAEKKGEEYRKYFESFLSSLDEKDSASDNLTEDYRKDYWLLMASFMNGGFCTQQNLNYLDENYPREYYRYRLEDLNDDGIPEFLLGYGYNGTDPNIWEIYRAGNSHRECFVGTAGYFDRERKAVFDDYGTELQTYSFDGEKLVPKESYYTDHTDCRDDTDEQEEITPVFYYEDEKHRVTEISEREFRSAVSGYRERADSDIDAGKLGPDNLACDLGIDRNAWAKETALRSYLAYMDFCVQNRADMKSYLFSLAYIDGDDVPEMTATDGRRYEIWGCRDGRMYRQEGSEVEGGNSRHVSYYPNRNIIRTYLADWGNMQEEYYIFRGVTMECPLVIRREALTSAFSNEFLKDHKGNIRYNYCVNEEIVSESEYERIREVFFEVFGLEDEVRFEKADVLTFDDMMAYLEKI
ncbi:MAG: hypothetical protein J5829_02235 [Lachnospiraceae bacterium]|nr:hypothetical protein [Lachnospiraceae bacterium]